MIKKRLFAAAAMTLAAGAVHAQEGPLVIYTSTPTEAMDELVARFNQSHPDIEVDYFRSGTTEVINRLEAEFAAGDPQPDVLLIADSVVMTSLKENDRLMRYEEAPVDGLDEGLYDPDMYFFGTKRITTGIMYNTEEVETPPTQWDDLLAPEVANRLTMPSPLYSGAALIHVGTMTGDERYGWDFYETLAEHGAVAGSGNGGVLDAVARGEMAYGVIVDFMALNAQAEGSPVAFVFPEDGVTAVTEPVAILADAENVEAAQAFVNWQLSEEGQAFHAEQGYLPLAEDVAAPEAFGDVTDLSVISADPAALVERDAEIKERFAGLFGG